MCINDNKIDFKRVVFSNGVFVVSVHCRRSLRSENPVACQRPVLDPFDPIMMSFMKDEPPLTCDPEEDWVTVKGNIARITDRVLKKYGDVQCKFMGSNGAQFCNTVPSTAARNRCWRRKAVRAKKKKKPPSDSQARPVFLQNPGCSFAQDLVGCKTNCWS